MTKIIRDHSGWKIRDSKGQYTAISFTTKSGEQFWISNRALKIILTVVLIATATLNGTVQASFAVPDKLIGWVLKGPVK